MREIIFRGRRIDNGEMVEGLLIRQRIEKNHGYEWVYSIQKFEKDNGTYYSYVQYEVDPETIGQYIGVADKNGKNIFKGDIVKSVSELCSNFGKTPTGKYATTFYEIACSNKNSYGFGTRRISSEYVSVPIYESIASKYYEVIGNIHDNPELLESEETHE